MNPPACIPAPPAKARIEIIPLIDVIFFLLATFVLFTLSMVKIQSIAIDLPKSADPRRQPVTEALCIQVSAQGTLFWEHEPITREELPRRLAALRKDKPDPRVLVAGDLHASYGDAIKVLDQVRLAGIDRATIETHVQPTGR